MYEYTYAAVIQRGGSGNCFPGGNFSPSRSPFPGTLFGAYVVVCDTLLMGRWIRLYREFKAEPMDEGGREKRLA